MRSRRPAPAGGVAVLVARILLGLVLIAHGWQKLVSNGLGATAEGFTGMGVPLPGVPAGSAGTAVLLGAHPQHPHEVE